MTSPEDEQPGPLYASTPRRAPETPPPAQSPPAQSARAQWAPSPSAPAPPPPSGFYQEQDQPTYEALYRDIYGETAPHPTSQASPPPTSTSQGAAPPPGWPQPQQPGYRLPAGAPVPPPYPGGPVSPWQTLYPAGTTPPREYGLALGLSAVGFLGVAGLQYFYIGKIGKGVVYLLTAGWFGIGTLVSMFTIGDEVVRTNDERRRGLR